MNFISGELCVCMLTLNHEFVKAFCNLINVNRWSAVDKEKGMLIRHLNIAIESNL